MMQPMLSADITDYDTNDDYDDKLRKCNKKKAQQHTSSEVYYQIRRVIEYTTRRLRQISNTVQQSVKDDTNGFCPILCKHTPKISYTTPNPDSWKVNVTIRCKATNQTSPVMVFVLILVLCSVCFISIIRIQSAMEHEYHVTNQFVQEQIIENEINRMYSQYLKQKELKDKERNMIANAEAYEIAASQAKKEAQHKQEQEQKLEEEKEHQTNDVAATITDDKPKKTRNRNHKVTKPEEATTTNENHGTNPKVIDENHHETNNNKDTSLEHGKTQRSDKRDDQNNQREDKIDRTSDSDHETTKKDDETLPHTKLDADLLLDAVPKVKNGMRFRKRENQLGTSQVDGNTEEETTTTKKEEEETIPQVSLDAELLLDVTQRAKDKDNMFRTRADEAISDMKKKKKKKASDDKKEVKKEVVSTTRKRLNNKDKDSDAVVDKTKLIVKATKTTTTIIPSSLSSVDSTVLRGGAGQRLLKLADANYLSNQLNYGLRTYWGYCPAPQTVASQIGAQNDANREIEIFHHLFAHQPVDMNEKVNKARRTGIALEYNTYANLNDVEVIPGFQKLIRLQPQDPIGALANPKNKKCPATCNVDKATVDMKFYTELRSRFKYQNEVDTFRGKHFTPDNGDSKQVTIGLHIRAGNGEKGDFVRLNRTIDDEDGWLDNMVTHILDVKKQQASGTRTVLFIATDTKSMIAKVEEALHKRKVTAIKVISYTNPIYTHPAEGTGVLFSDKPIGTTGSDTCLKGWEHTYIDMMLLSYVDVLIAARPSAFTQSLPMSLLYDANSNSHQSIIKKYCEVTNDGTGMKCYTSFQQWCCDGTTSYIFNGTQKYDYVRVPSNPSNLIPATTDTRKNKLWIQPRNQNCMKPLPIASSTSKLNDNQNTCLPYEWSQHDTQNKESVVQIK